MSRVSVQFPILKRFEASCRKQIEGIAKKDFTTLPCSVDDLTLLSRDFDQNFLRELFVEKL